VRGGVGELSIGGGFQIRFVALITAVCAALVPESDRSPN
jgi:hypothetical protein